MFTCDIKYNLVCRVYRVWLFKVRSIDLRTPKSMST